MLLVAFALLLLLYAGNDSPGRTPSTNNVLVSHGQQVALLHGQLLVVHHPAHLCVRARRRVSRERGRVGVKNPATSLTGPSPASSCSAEQHPHNESELYTGSFKLFGRREGAQ
jgi:hypothetical protein